MFREISLPYLQSQFKYILIYLSIHILKIRLVSLLIRFVYTVAITKNGSVRVYEIIFVYVRYYTETDFLLALSLLNFLKFIMTQK